MIVRDQYAFVITQEMIESGLKGNELIVWGYLDYKAYNVKGAYEDGLKQLARVLRLSEPTIYNIVKKLVEKGLFKKEYIVDENNQTRVSLRPHYSD